MKRPRIIYFFLALLSPPLPLQWQNKLAGLCVVAIQLYYYYLLLVSESTPAMERNDATFLLEECDQKS